MTPESNDHSTSIFFDSGPIISFTTTNLLFLLKAFKETYGRPFVITPKVRGELIDKPILTKRYRFEALQILNELREGNISIIEDPELEKVTKRIGAIANQCFLAHNEPIQIVHPAEIEAVCYAKELGSNTVVIDERTMRLLIESPDALHTILQKKLHTKIKKNKKKIAEFQEYAKGMHVLRSVEFGMMAYKSGMLDNYSPVEYGDRDVILLNSMLWGLKLNGCSISDDEIDRLSQSTSKYSS